MKNAVTRIWRVAITPRRQKIRFAMGETSLFSSVSAGVENGAADGVRSRWAFGVTHRVL